MKIFKKALVAATILTLVFSAVPANAATNTIDFENGDMTGFSALLTDADSDQCELSVKDFDGSKALFIDVKDSTKAPKIKIDALALVGASNLDKIRTIKFHLTIVNPKGEKIAWNGGGLGALTGTDGSVWYQSANQWELSNDEKDTGALDYSDTFAEGKGFTKDATVSAYLFMKWSGSENDMYIDNVQFLDADGNALAIAAAGTDTGKKDTNTTDQKDTGKTGKADKDNASTEITKTTETTKTAETAKETTTDTTEAPKTGTNSYALFFLAGAAVMLTGAVVVKKHTIEKE